MNPGQLLSLKRRIGAAQAFALTKLTEEVAALGPPVAEELVSAVAERMEQGAYVTTGAVAALVAASRDRRLYEAGRQHLFTDIWALIALLRADIPDPAIETRLRDELYRAYQSSDDPRRSYILDAFDQHGSSQCVDDLEAILYEFAPRLQTLKLTQDILGEPERLDPRNDPHTLLDVVTRKADIDFGAKLRSAVQRIRERAAPPAIGWDASPAPANPFSFARSYIQRAEQHVTGQDYGAALNYCRKALEAALKSFIKERGLAVKKDVPIDKLELPPLIAVINSQVDLPKDIRMAIESVQRDSTYGSHDQGVVPEEGLTTAIAQATIDKYNQIVVHLAKLLSRSS